MSKSRDAADQINRVNSSAANATAITIDSSENVNFSANATFGNNDKAVFGAANPLEIYHDGSNKYIQDTGGGSLFIRGSDLVLEDAGGNDYITMSDTGTGGTVTLKHSASTKLATTSTGVDVSGNIIANANASATYAMIRSSDTGVASLYFGNQSDAATASIAMRHDSGNALQFNGYNNTERMRINSSGKVGIATSAPDALLNVGGTGTALGGTAGNEVKLLTLEVASANADRLQFTSERISSGTNWESAAHRIQRKVDSTTMGYLQFGHPGNPNDLISFGKTDEEFMRILGTGDLLIGTTAVIDTGAENSLQILGSTSTDKWCIATKSKSRGHIHYHTSTAGISHYFVVNNNNVGMISHDATSTAYNTSSDYRLKTDAQQMTGASARVQALNPVNFQWIASGHRVDGFLAHEAQEVVPECATGTRDGMKDEEYEVTPAVYEDVVTPAVEAVEATYDEDGLELTEATEGTPETRESVLVTDAVMGTRNVPDYQGIDQSKLVPLLTAALQEALAKIESMETRLTALEG